MFETYIYQPFFNLLVGLYWFLGQLSPDLADMGIAVIIFSLFVRVLLLPLTFAGETSEEEKKEIVTKIAAIKQEYSHEPIRQKEEIKKVMRGNVRIVVATSINILIQIGLILMLYRIFATGLGGADFHLLYSFIPRVDHINLMFLGKYDLSHTNSTLNILQSIMIFVVEILGAMRSTAQIRKKDIAIMQLILPVGSYIIFMFLPAGKKLFVITSLAFSAVYSVIKIIQETFDRLMTKLAPEEPVVEPPTPTITLTQDQLQALTSPTTLTQEAAPTDQEPTPPHEGSR